MDKEKELDGLFADFADEVFERRHNGTDEDAEDEEGDTNGYFHDELRYTYRRIDDL